MRVKSSTDLSFFGMGYGAGTASILVNRIMAVDT
jgi:hypothetical protein